MSLSRRSLLVAAAAAPVIAFAATRSAAQTQRVYNNAGIAIDGTDPVAYFTKGRPVAGNASMKLNWMGADWYFSSEENRAAFEADAKAYAPQYGGYCAWAVSQGYTASTVPDAWAIVDGKLYLNYSMRIQRRWEDDIQGHIAAANAQWPGVLTS
jgi:YHS domain-containing protein